jgi:hypothetical protein
LKKLAIVVLLVAAAAAAGCRRTAGVGGPGTVNEPGAATARQAVDKFMAAAHSQDLQAMSLVWGTSQGPAIQTMDKEERDQREIIMMCHLKHDRFQGLGEAPSTAGERAIAVELKFKDLTRSTNFYLTRGPNNRWFVRSFDLEPLREICAKR